MVLRDGPGLSPASDTSPPGWPYDRALPMARLTAATLLLLTLAAGWASFAASVAAARTRHPRALRAAQTRARHTSPRRAAPTGGAASALASAQDWEALAQAGVAQADQWRHGSWYCEYLACAHGPYPLLTVWGEVPMFESVDALEIAHPSIAHYELVNRFARASEHYWNPYLGGYAPYPEDRYRGAEAWFDDNGWLGLAFLNAYRATNEHRYLRDAQRAFHFIAAQGWDYQGGGGMWWNTEHPYHSGPALASDSLLGTLLYQDDHETWQLEDVKGYIAWANGNDRNDSRHLYLEKANEPNSINDYVQAPLIYAQYLLCQDGQGQAYCERAASVAATMAERYVANGYSFNYGPAYDAIFMQWMEAYGQATQDSHWLWLAEVNAQAAASNAANEQGLWLSSWWGGAIQDPETHPGMFRTMGATTSLFAWLAVYGTAAT
jgi:hypothetical protein